MFVPPFALQRGNFGVYDVESESFIDSYVRNITSSLEFTRTEPNRRCLCRCPVSLKNTCWQIKER